MYTDDANTTDLYWKNLEGLRKIHSSENVRGEAEQHTIKEYSKWQGYKI